MNSDKKQEKATKRMRRLLIEMLVGIVFLTLVAILFSNSDMRSTQQELSATVNYIREQCNGYERVNYASETKSLMRMIESAHMVDDQMTDHMIAGNNDLSDETMLAEWADKLYLTGVLFLDADGNVLSEYYKEDDCLSTLREELQSEPLLDVARYPERSYSVRAGCPDGSYIDLAGVCKSESSTIIVAYYHTPKDYVDVFNLSFESLLAGYDVTQNGTIVITRGNRIVVANDPSLEGKNPGDISIIRYIRQQEQSDTLVQTKITPAGNERMFGVMEHGRNYYIYAYMPERQVFASTPRNMVYAAILYVLVVIVISMVRWKLEQRYQEEWMIIQQAYTNNLQNKNRELERAVEQADRASAAKSSFLSRVSHDIRTPLNGIIGLLEIDNAHPDDAELIRKNRGKILVSAKHLLSLINDILQMSKLESGEIVLSHEVIDLQQLSNDVLTIVEQRSADAGITLEDHNNGECFAYAKVYGSPLHIRQIFLNIYINCIKYNKVGGKVDVACECLDMSEDTVTYRWTITDTGIGMSEQFLEHIFDPFSQEHSDARSVHNGTGLGMSIVKSLLDKMNGMIEVTSEEGVGSTFVVTIPFEIAKEAEATQTAQPEDADQNAKIEGLNLLLAEDNELNAEIVQTLLCDEGAKITWVTDGQQALLAFRGSTPGTFDAILMDIMMPVMDGLTATREIRACDHADAQTIPIIAMTANAFDEDARRCMAAGMNAHLSKPLDMRLVARTIAGLCRQKSEHKITKGVDSGKGNA